MLPLTPYVFLVGSGQLGLSHYKDCHIYLLRDGDDWALIDAGAGLDTDGLIETLSRLGVEPTMPGTVFLTHAHADHAGGVKSVREWSGCRVAASAREAELAAEGDEYLLGLTAAKRSGRYPSDYRFSPFQVDFLLEESGSYSVGRIRLRPLLTPGHSAGSLCFLADFPDGLRGLFSGDTVFWGGYISLINTPGSDLREYRESMPKLRGLGVDALFPGHFLWDLRRGQRQLDIAIERFQGSVLPPNLQL